MTKEFLNYTVFDINIIKNCTKNNSLELSNIIETNNRYKKSRDSTFNMEYSKSNVTSIESAGIIESEEPHEVAIRISSSDKSRDFNEADTRHKIIDEVIHGVLSWPKTQTFHESYIGPGYADYRLKRSNGDDYIFLEAKKEGIYFKLPNNFNGHKLSCHISVKTLLTNNDTKKAMEQVWAYCMEEGCEFAGITNGHEWIFFKTF